MDQDGAFSAFASAQWSTLVRSAVFLGCTVEEAQDLAQTTLLRCYTAWRRVEQAEDRDGYVYRILVNCHRDSRRRRWWGERPSDIVRDRSVEDPAVAVAVEDAVRRALGDLTSKHREVVVLRYFVHLSERRTAAVLGVAPGTVKSRLARALSRLETNAHLADLVEGWRP